MSARDIPVENLDTRWRETASLIEGSQGGMVGILAEPTDGPCHAAVLIVAGQPQTRVGAHRMFTELARGLAQRGVASLRFDIGGWGDSLGKPLPFEESGEDIAAAATALHAAVPSGTPLWLWGLCDGASAAVFALPTLRAQGIDAHALCLVNPWVRSEASHSSALVRTYYARRLFDRELWVRLVTGKVSLGNLLEPVRHLTGRFRASPAVAAPDSAGASAPASAPDSGPASTAAEANEKPDLPAQMLACLDGYTGKIFTVLAGKDLTAGETDALMKLDKRWRKRLDQRGRLLRVPEADHTFSNPEHWQQVCEWVAEKARA